MLLVLAGLVAPLAVSARAQAPIVVAVTADRHEATLLAKRGFDLVEMRDGAEVHVVLWPGDAERLRALGFAWRIVADDLLAEHAAAALPDPGTPTDTPSTEPPRTTYRTLAEHHAELRALATDHPQLVTLLELGRSLEGRPILGVRIAIGDAGDGRPEIYFDGVHHAREWPSGEYVMGFAHRLVSDALTADARVTGLLRRTAVVLVPVVNPDGFTISRSAPVDGSEDAFGLAGIGAYWRKNARALVNDHERGISIGAYGVDPNRNYPFGWGTGTLIGGEGASGNPADLTYEGPAPASEPEVQAVRNYVLTHNVTGVITNHTYGNLVLYPWGHTAGASPDDALFRQVAARLADANKYTPQPGIDLYATTGTMDDWAYAATGTIGFTFEHGRQFHPTYGVLDIKRSQNEEAFLRLIEAGADETMHGILTGRVVDARGVGVPATLRLTKTADIPLDDGTSPERIDLRLRTARDGTFRWHLNPSDKPLDLDDYLLTVESAVGKPSRLVRVVRGGVTALGDLPIG